MCGHRSRPSCGTNPSCDFTDSHTAAILSRYVPLKQNIFMKHSIYMTTLAIALTFCDLLHAQTIDNKIVIGAIDSIQSTILNEQRKLWVYVPNSGSANADSQQKYPVIYLLDGENHFNSVTGMAEYLSNTMIIPEMIIVGIPNTNRFRDLSPTKPSESTFPLPPFVGGGEAFTSFLEKELMPYIESKYPTAPYRLMIGHSLGGLMVINTMLHHCNLFNSYLAIDPSLWWDNDLMVKQADSIFQQKKFDGKSLYIAMANNGITEGMDLTSVMKDTTEESANSRPMLLFSDVLESRKTYGLRWKFHYYPDDNHGSVTMIAAYDALRFFFDKYTIPLSYFYNAPKPSFNADSVIITHFKTASEQMGYTVLPPENFVHEQAYNMMYNNDLDRAFRLFDLNISNYPSSYNAYDRMGDYYMAKNDKEKAIIYFTKALELKEVPATRKKLEELKTNDK